MEELVCSKYGFKYILRHSSYDLLAVTANGFYRLKPVRRIYPDPSANLEIIFHEPIANNDARKMHGQALVNRIEETIRTSYQP